MSRQSPTGFLFSMVFEIAVVVAIVSFLPRVDLRPLGQASGAVMSQAVIAQPLPANSPVTPVGWTDDARTSPQPRSHETSYYQRPAAPPAAEVVVATPAPTRQSPPLISAPPADPAYVEKRLDRASQQLVNTVGSAVSNTASNIMNYSPPPPANALPQSSASFPTQKVAAAASSAAPQLNFEQPTTTKPARRFAAESPAKSQRPWLRY
jgi:hypothetical protein